MKKLMTILLLIITSAVSARTIGGVKLPDIIKAGGAELPLNGAGLRTKFGLKVYAGGLYLKAPSSNAAQIIAADEPMAIRLHFIRTVGKDTIIGAWTDGFKNSAGPAYDSLKPRIDQFNACFGADSVANTIYDIMYVPGQGVAVSINGSRKAAIPGLDFKKAVFGIWLCPKPADADLKKGMLGK